jgi:hypothetical protein
MAKPHRSDKERLNHRYLLDRRPGHVAEITTGLGICQKTCFAASWGVGAGIIAPSATGSRDGVHWPGALSFSDQGHARQDHGNARCGADAHDASCLRKNEAPLLNDSSALTVVMIPGQHGKTSLKHQLMRIYH